MFTGHIPKAPRSCAGAVGDRLASRLGGTAGAGLARHLRGTAGALLVAAMLATLLAPGSALAAHRHRHRHRQPSGPSVAGVPSQRDIVMPSGKVVVFLTCLGTSPCSGVVKLHLRGSALRRLAGNGSPGRRGTRRHRRLAAWTHRRGSGVRHTIARRRVLLRQRRVTPVTLQLPTSTVSLLRRDGGTLAVRAIVRVGRRTISGTIVLQLAGVGVGAA